VQLDTVYSLKKRCKIELKTELVLPMVLQRKVSTPSTNYVPDFDVKTRGRRPADTSTSAFYLQQPQDQGKLADPSVLTVLCHGFSHEASTLWPLGQHLANVNRTVVATFDFHGRGRSQWGGERQTPKFLLRQLHNLIESLRLVGAGKVVADQPLPVTVPTFTQINLLGFSMGGAVAALFTQTYPQLVNKVLFLDPAGLPLQIVLAGRIVQLPVIGTWFANWFGPSTTVQNQCNNYYKKEGKEYEQNLQERRAMIRSQLANNRSYMGALTSCLQNFDFGGLAPVFQSIGEQTLSSSLPHVPPVLIIWGDHDVVCPYENASKLHELIPRAQLLTIKDSGHDPLDEHPTVTYRAVERYFAGDSTKQQQQQQQRSSL
jgi:pimeloyl-ACP methyl ester carboxylesterase